MKSLRSQKEESTLSAGDPRTPSSSNSVRRAPGVYVPQDTCIDWTEVEADPSTPIIVTNSAARARRLCKMGEPAIAILGVSKAEVAELLRKRGANVLLKSGRLA